ncbi:MAG: AMIN domain-containing protein [Desulfuromonadales bacterium]
MSSILKSLRKIEKEQRAARQTAPDLMHDQGLAPVKARPLLPLLAGIILGAMIVAGWGLWSSRETPPGVMTQPLPKPEEAAPAAMQIPGIASSGQTGKSADSEPGADSLPKNDLSGQLAGQPGLFSRTSTVTLSPQTVTVAGSQDAAKAKPAVNESVNEVLLPRTVQVTQKTNVLRKISLSAGRAVVETDGKIGEFQYYTLGDPNRLVVDLYDSKPAFMERSFSIDDGFNQLRVGIYDDKTRLVFDAGENLLPNYNVEGHAANILVTWGDVATAPLGVDTAADATQSIAKAAVTVNARADQASVLPDGISLQVSEIFYQQDSASSMAVVNDLPVMVGSQVDSAVVTEIRPDSVVFAIGDRTYVVDQSNP